MKNSLCKKMSKLFKLEAVAIFLAIFSLWPRILGWRHVAFDILLYLFLGLMILIAVRRVGMVKNAFKGDG